jgi:hypothetical protein
MTHLPDELHQAVERMHGGVANLTRNRAKTSTPKAEAAPRRWLRGKDVLTGESSSHLGMPTSQDEEVRFAPDSPLEGTGFELLVLRVSHMIQPIRLGIGRRAVSSRSAANHLSDSVH